MLGFLSTSLWGQVGLSLTRPLHGRTPGPKDGTNELNSGLRACMQCLMVLLSSPIPRFLPFAQSGVAVAVSYADAFFRLGDRKWSVSVDDLPAHWPSNMHLAENGWGFICRNAGRVTAEHGQVPPEILRRFGARRSNIQILFLRFSLRPSASWPTVRVCAPNGSLSVTTGQAWQHLAKVTVGISMLLVFCFGFMHCASGKMARSLRVGV